MPLAVVRSKVPTIASVRPYSPLELEGRDLYIREGCYVCHSQMIRPFRWETMRYGEVSRLEDSFYDHPFQWGSKRTGPDLHREGGKYPDAWHYNHLDDPRSTSPGSIMPRYPWLLTQKLDKSAVIPRMKALRKVGVSYTDDDIAKAEENLDAQADKIVKNLKVGSVETEPDREIVAVIAYLQRLGTDIKAAPKAEPVKTTSAN